MIRVCFTANIQRHVSCPDMEVQGETLRDVMSAVFASNPDARAYVLDEHGAVRRHMNIFINGESARDRESLSDAVPADAEVYVMQALSGG